MRITIETAISCVRELEPKLVEIGCHAALTGGCLYRGGSNKDVDVIIYPHDPANPANTEALKMVLANMGFVPRYETDADYVNRRVWVYGRDIDGQYVRFDFFIT